ncbi:unnamed protein product [Spirodela intermedia]|uniref:Uncharacterized protein n=1 Tax=Spirodela intermedia TaxID=51605 RepID=A0A7I8KXL0_SPIIN|nr:unnamed protein product [Spirodela intermedia]
MSTVVTILENHTPIQAPTTKITRTESMELRFRSLETLAQDGHSQIVSTDGPRADSTLSMQSSNRGDDHFYSSTTRLLGDRKEFPGVTGSSEDVHKSSLDIRFEQNLPFLVSWREISRIWARCRAVIGPDSMKQFMKRL